MSPLLRPARCRGYSRVERATDSTRVQFSVQNGVYEPPPESSKPSFCLPSGGPSAALRLAPTRTPFATPMSIAELITRLRGGTAAALGP